MNWKSLLSAQRSERTPAYSEPSRSAFEQDYDRIIFSHPFRRLQDKTQVHPLPEHDFVHTRLTHSLEVSSVGRSLGKKVGSVILDRNPSLKTDFTLYDFGAIVAAASLAHDLGNPPFGHAGEDAISDFFNLHPIGKSFQDKLSVEEWSDLTHFEGNAQGFRIVNKNQYGLKLTYATLGAFTKYPCTSHFPNRDKSKRSQKKFGFFESEKKIFQSIASALQLKQQDENSWHRHPLTYLVEAADDICYSIIDLEDGCSLGLVRYEDARELFMGVISKNKDKLAKLDQLSSQQERIGYLRALAIGDLMEECSTLFLDHEREILDGSFDQALADLCFSRHALKDIIDVSVDKIYRARKVVEIEAAGHQVIPGLLEEFTTAGVHYMEKSKNRKYSNLQKLLPAEFEPAMAIHPSDYYRMLRLIVDFVSGLTDKHAISLYQRIKGMA
ncbi:deoxyguanosinetriphosphate triphosphohydrolase [Pseudochryseolinea flava]|uniref:Deoxyguanosinetriphosphate triphosphohydrolase n=1 Tax=Pseudochryseolinea flava TaxID=2059302 RepID=A0A364Y958_9BACT|nr:deoxyguanosinetriphosphate triphosphohydrolase [Pseudochryseolinea flava]RAW03507.1 deoxyguanosinetriphosphate triphosphohydrolase [Pseudochryseolinea flava]